MPEDDIAPDELDCADGAATAATTAGAWVTSGNKAQDTPTDVYDAVNEIVAGQLAREPLRLPMFADVVARHEAARPSMSPAKGDANIKTESKSSRKRMRTET